MSDSAYLFNSVYLTSVQNKDKKPNETCIFRHPFSVGKDLWKLSKVNTLQDIYKWRFIERSDFIGFGRRQLDSKYKLTDHVEWFENSVMRIESEKVGSGIINMNLLTGNEEAGFGPLKFVGIYAKNSLEYLQLDFACGFYGFTVVPIYDTLGETATEWIFQQTKMELCALTVDHLATVLKSKREKEGFRSLKTVVVLDPWMTNEDLKALSEGSGVTVVTVDELKERGAEKIHDWAKLTPESVYCVCYTSGTTGVPKGAVLTHGNMVSCTRHAEIQLAEVSEEDLYLSYLPMAHVLERVIVNFVMSQKGRLALFSGDVLKLRDDLKVFKPTLFVSVPRLFNKVYDGIVQSVKGKGWFAQMLFNNGLRVKRSNLAKDCLYTHSLYDKLVFRKAQEALGGRVRMMLSGSAPISPDVLESLKCIFCCPIVEGYGQTEGTALEFISHQMDKVTGHVGGPAVHNEFKLVDIPDMKYLSSDKDEEGRPKPRGEIWVRGPNVSPGYYMAPELNAESFTEDGWLMTGDVGELFGTEPRMRIVDRKKNMFKLSQGEYIAPEKLENGYKQSSPYITGVFVYGDSLMNNIVAVVNMEEKGLLKLAADIGITGVSAEELTQRKEVKASILAMFEKTAKELKYNSLERPKAVLVELRQFQDLGLLTDAFKLKRAQAKAHFLPQLSQLYAHLSSA